METIQAKLCIICGVEEESDKPGDCGPFFSKDVKLVKFCGELELSSSSLLSSGYVEFTAFNFLQQLEKWSNFVKICDKCSCLISETVEKRRNLEEVECEVLELQIKLLIKLKELKDVSKLYFGKMGKVKDKVKACQFNGLEKYCFGDGKEECNVLGFRKTILNVATSQAIFQDNLNTKLCQDQNCSSEDIPNEMGLSPASSPPNCIPSIMEDPSNDFNDEHSLSSPPPRSPPDLDNEKEPILGSIKMKNDNQLEGEQNKEEELRFTQDKVDKPQKDNQKLILDKEKQVVMNRPKCSKASSEKFKTLNELRRHRKNPITINICEICGRNFSRGSSLRRHHQLVHPPRNTEGEEMNPVKKFQCTVCGKKFANLTNCGFHEDTHKPKEMRQKVTCSFCGKEVLQRCYSLHKSNYCPQQAAGNVTRMTCDICGKSYKSGKSLGDHLVRTHKLPERPKFK